MWKVRRLQTERWRLDLDSHILFAPASAEGPGDGRYFWLTSYQHEVAHWVRWQSSSIGLLLTLLRRAQVITAANTLSNLTERGRELVLDLRHTRPLWSFRTGFEPELISHDFALAGQMWLDMKFLNHALIDSGDWRCEEWVADDAIGPALSDAWRAAESFPCMAAHPGNEVADHQFIETPTDAARNYVRIDQRLTTRAIWESACTLDEVATDDYGASADDLTEHLRLVRAKLESDRYGFALKVAQGMVGSVSAPLFRLVAWLATDPPLPFLEPEGDALRWSHFSPPYRFMRLYAAIRDSPSLQQVPNETSIYDFAEDLLDRAKLQRAVWPKGTVELGILGVERGREVSVYEALPDFELFPGSTQKFVGSLNMLTKSSLALRMSYCDSPSKFVYPSSSDLYTSRGEICDGMKDAQTLWSLLVPLAMDFADGLHQGGFDPQSGAPVVRAEHMTEYVGSVLMRESLEALIEGRAVRWKSLPRAFRAALSTKYPTLAERILESKMDLVW